MHSAMAKTATTGANGCGMEELFCDNILQSLDRAKWMPSFRLLQALHSSGVEVGEWDKSATSTPQPFSFVASGCVNKACHGSKST